MEKWLSVREGGCKLSSRRVDLTVRPTVVESRQGLEKSTHRSLRGELQGAFYLQPASVEFRLAFQTHVGRVHSPRGS